MKNGKNTDSIPNGVYYSPYCLQELETLSWALNRFKVAPTPIRYYKSDQLLVVTNKLATFS